MLELYRTIRKNKWLNLFAILIRCLIGVGFTFAAFPKIMGERFTQISVEDPVGFFFEAMYQTGMYWNFLGWSQLIASFLLMTQRFSTLGAIMFFPIILNIHIITWSMGFQGTPVITFLMLLATTFLLVWDFEKLKLILYPDNYSVQDVYEKPSFNNFWIIVGFVLFSWTVYCGVSRKFFPLAIGCTAITVGAIIVHLFSEWKKKKSTVHG